MIQARDIIRNLPDEAKIRLLTVAFDMAYALLPDWEQKALDERIREFVEGER